MQKQAKVIGMGHDKDGYASESIGPLHKSSKNLILSVKIFRLSQSVWEQIIVHDIFNFLLLLTDMTPRKNHHSRKRKRLQLMHLRRHLKV